MAPKDWRSPGCWRAIRCTPPVIAPQPFRLFGGQKRPISHRQARPGLRRGGLRWRLLTRETAAQDVGKRFDAQLDKHERFGNQVCAAAQARTCATLEVGKA